jgi:hypothetical protein
MTISRGHEQGSPLRMALGFILGVLAMPAMIFAARPSPDEVGDAQFYAAPREVRYHLVEAVSASDRYDQRAVVGSSMVDNGFSPPPGDPTARYALNGMRVDETTQIVRNLISRPRPPEVIIIDWAALHDIPHDLLPNQRGVLTYYSLEYLKFALARHWQESGEPVRLGNATWINPSPKERFHKRSVDRMIAFGTLFAEYSRLEQFADDLASMCHDSDTRFVIVRFPVFQPENGKEAIRQLGDLDSSEYHTSLKATRCEAEFVDLLAESIEAPLARPAYLSDRSLWLDYNHFRPAVGEELLADPRLGG